MTHRSIALLALLFAPALFAQHQHDAAPAQEKPVELYKGLGIWTHPIGTKNAEAQKFFDQGLDLWYGFNRPEAVRSFKKALELDPGAAMAQWGIAQGLGPYVNMDVDPDIHMKESCEAVQAGLKMHTTPAARAYLEAASSRCPEFDAPKYAAAMKKLAAQFPDDPDAQTLYAESLMLLSRWHWYSPDGKPAAGTAEAERTLEGVLRHFPDHPGANHFYIHAVESSPTPERAVPSAQRLMGIMPEAGHMVHMPGHIWLVLGEYQTSVDVNERAAEVDREFFARTGSMSVYYMYYLHNLQFIVYSRAMQGHLADTRKAIAEFSEAAGMMPEMAEPSAFLIVTTRLRVGEWDQLLAEPQPKSESPIVQAFWRFGRALSQMAKGRMPEAVKEQQEFENIRKKLDPNMPWNTYKLGDVINVAAAELDARMETSPAKAIAKWRHAVELQDGLSYDEPPAWYYPIRESLGAALLLSGDAAGAEAAFREGLRRSPKNGRILFGLMESLKAQNKAEAAAWVEREYQNAWRGADIVLRIKDL